MLKKFILTIRTLVCVALLVPGLSYATSLSLESTSSNYQVGDTITFDLMADIDGDDAIMGFGFDLSLDGGVTWISAGTSGSVLSFDSFTVNSALGFSYDSLYDTDSDTISGMLDLFDPDVYGDDLVLGTFSFTVFSEGSETITIGADSVGTVASLEGLVPGYTATSAVSFFPNDISETVTVSSGNTTVPEPTSFLLMGLGLLAGFWRRRCLLQK